MDGEEKELLESLQDKIAKLSVSIEKMKLAEYVSLLDHPWRLLFINFISGLARGFGITIGFAILGAVIVLILQRLVTLNLPVIGDFVAAIVAIVQTRLAG